MEDTSLTKIFALSELELLANQVDAKRSTLLSKITQVLRQHLFFSRIDLRPSDIKYLAEQEVKALIESLRSSYETAKDHGKLLCIAGLNNEAVYGLIETEQKFFIEEFQDNPNAIRMAYLHMTRVFEGYFSEREVTILHEQESIRAAIGIALERTNIEKQNAQAAAQKATESSYRRVINAQEDERRRISRELHDDAGQAMVGIRISLESLQTGLQDHPELKEGIAKAAHWTEIATQKIRALAYRLRPTVLDLLGLNLAVKQQCIDFSEMTGLIISYSGVQIDNISDELAISIYRIVQEGLANTAKHSGAKHAWVRLRQLRSTIDLTIKDDGHGFDSEAIHPGIGLVSMRERSHLLHGNMQIQSAKGGPTLFKFSFPRDHQITEVES